MVGVDEVLDEAVLDVTNVMVWVTLRRRVRETRTGGGPSALAFNPDIQ